MATLNKQFTFTSDAESFSPTAEDGSATLDWYSGDGNPSGSLRSRIVGRNKTSNNYWEWSGTWEDLGITSGDTIDQVRLAGHDSKVHTWDTADQVTIGPIEIRDSAGTTVIATLWSGRTNTTGTEGSWSDPGAQTYQSIGSSYQASNTSIRIRLNDYLDNGNSGAATCGFLQDNFDIDIDYTEVGGSDDLTGVDIASTTSVDSATLTQNQHLTGTDIASTTSVDSPTLTQVHNLTGTDISSETTLDSAVFSWSDNTYGVDDPNWFFAPEVWYKSGTSYAITNNVGAYMKLRFEGTGISMTIDLTLFEATSPSASDFPYIAWRTDLGSWNRVQTTTGQTTFTFETGLSNTTHSIEIYFDGIQRNRDRWNNPSASVRFDDVTITEGILIAPILEPERWLIFGDSRVEAVAALANTYDVSGQSAHNTWGIQVARENAAEIGVVGFVAQGFTWPSTGSSNVVEFHFDDNGNETWDELFDTVSRDYSNIDTIIIAHGANDETISEQGFIDTVVDFLETIRVSFSGKFIFVVPFLDESVWIYPATDRFTAALREYHSNNIDTNCFLINIQGQNSQLDYDLSWQTPVTYSYDGGHPNELGHTAISNLINTILDGDYMISFELDATTSVDAPTLTESSGLDALTGVDIASTTSVDTGTLTENQHLTGTEIASTTSVDTGTLTENQHLTGTEIASTTSVDSPTLTEAQSLVGTDIASTTSVDSSTLFENQHLTGTDISSVTTVDASTLSENQHLTGTDISATTSVDAPVLSEAGTDALIGVDISSVTSVDTATYSEHQYLTGTDISSITTVDSPTLTEAQSLVGVDISSITSVDSATLTENQHLTGVDISATTSVDPGILSSEGVDNLVGVDISAISSVDTATYSERQYLTGSDISSTTSVDSGTLTENQHLTGSDISSTTSVDTPILAESNNLTGVDISVTTSVDSAVMSQHQYFVGVDISAVTTVDPGQLILVRLEVPDERVYSIPIDNRIIYVDADVRIIDVDEEDRTVRC